MRAELLEISSTFPIAGLVASGETIEIQARATLAILLLSELEPLPSPRAEEGEWCPNCLKPFSSERSPYCSTQCREEAAFVRQFRSSVVDGTLKDPDKQVALGQKFWHLIGGGYPLRQTLAPPSSLKQLYKRTNSLCEICGAPATTFDHTGSG